MALPARNQFMIDLLRKELDEDELCLLMERKRLTRDDLMLIGSNITALLGAHIKYDEILDSQEKPSV